MANMPASTLNKNAKLWVAALRSGKYNQGRGRLLSYVNEVPLFCPLGVGCDVFRIKTGGGIWKADRYSSVKDTFIDRAGKRHVGVLPDSVTVWLGLEKNNGGNIVLAIPELNDNHGYSFSKIASFIESMPKGLFRMSIPKTFMRAVRRR